METICWFCGKRIRPGKATNRHHTLARRYYTGNPNKGNLVVLTHRTCHLLWHREVERGDLSYPFYVVLMQALNYGWLFYAEEATDGCPTDQGFARLVRPLLPRLSAPAERPRTRSQTPA